ncbi:hypothetical protein EVAR_63653_1 [Eumeta japonica]|uniref:Uncharacterized protein n=1 Tax=Eumeta variegata TaxID=151549 RepID=A0A4C1ZDY1_EUMVA|nr:hypothetical protein EVAR_63653_1 [Eumeta japonica]
MEEGVGHRNSYLLGERKQQRLFFHQITIVIAGFVYEDQIAQLLEDEDDESDSETVRKTTTAAVCDNEEISDCEEPEVASCSEESVLETNSGSGSSSSSSEEEEDRQAFIEVSDEVAVVGRKARINVKKRRSLGDFRGRRRSATTIHHRGCLYTETLCTDDRRATHKRGNNDDDDGAHLTLCSKCPKSGPPRAAAPPHPRTPS